MWPEWLQGELPKFDSVVVCRCDPVAKSLLAGDECSVTPDLLLGETRSSLHHFMPDDKMGKASFDQVYQGVPEEKGWVKLT